MDAQSLSIFAVRRLAPMENMITRYDREHFLTYARLIDAEQAGTDWREAASAILLCNVDRNPEGTLRCWQSHLARAYWVVAGKHQANCIQLTN